MPSIARRRESLLVSAAQKRAGEPVMLPAAARCRKLRCNAAQVWQRLAVEFCATTRPDSSAMRTSVARKVSRAQPARGNNGRKRELSAEINTQTQTGQG